MPVCMDCKTVFKYRVARVCPQCESKRNKENNLPRQVKQVNLAEAKRVVKEATYNKIIQEVYVFGDKIIDIIEAGKKVMFQ